MSYAGRLKLYFNKWETITKDEFVLDTIKGYKIPFCKSVVQNRNTSRSNSLEELCELEKAIAKLEHIGAIAKSKEEAGQFLSSYFLRPKADGSYRFILNLKSINEFIVTEHFKLEDLRTVVNIIRPNDYLCSIDLKDAYLLIPIHKHYRKYLKFLFKNSLYEFSSLPFGLSTAPFVFTKVLRPVVTYLRKLNIRCVIYLDDLLILGSSFEECQKNMRTAVDLFTFLGFIVNEGKSNLILQRKCKFLGMIINTQDWQIELPGEKRIKIKSLVLSFMNKNKCKIRDLAQLVGFLVAACPAVEYSWMNYKELERVKYLALNFHDGNYEKTIKLPHSILEDLKWWYNHVMIYNSPIRSFQYIREIFSDSSKSGWGAYCNLEMTHGFWTEIEGQKHINYLELLAAFLGLKCFAAELHTCQVLLRIDNTTAIAYINKQGGIQFPELNAIAKDIWRWCEMRKIWVFAEYISSKDNVEADAGSRITNLDTEWELSDFAIDKIVSNFGIPEIDLFATRCNTKTKKYCSWQRDPEAWTINAFTLNWNNIFWYAFPPFALLPRILKKIQDEKTRGIIVAPLWNSQSWFPTFESLLEGNPIIFNPSKNLLISPCRKKTHPLYATLTLIAGVLSAKHL